MSISHYSGARGSKDTHIIMKKAGPLGLMGREPAHQNSEPGSNPSWDATVHPVCETFNVMHVV